MTDKLISFKEENNHGHGRHTYKLVYEDKQGKQYTAYTDDRGLKEAQVLEKLRLNDCNIELIEEYGQIKFEQGQDSALGD